MKPSGAPNTFSTSQGGFGNMGFNSAAQMAENAKANASKPMGFGNSGKSGGGAGGASAALGFGQAAGSSSKPASAFGASGFGQPALGGGAQASSFG